MVLLESMGKIILNRRDNIQADLANEILKLAFMEMTKSKVCKFLILYNTYIHVYNVYFLLTLSPPRPAPLFVFYFF